MGFYAWKLFLGRFSLLHVFCKRLQHVPVNSREGLRGEGGKYNKSNNPHPKLLEQWPLPVAMRCTKEVGVIIVIVIDYCQLLIEDKSHFSQQPCVRFHQTKFLKFGLHNGGNQEKSVN